MVRQCSLYLFLTGVLILLPGCMSSSSCEPRQGLLSRLFNRNRGEECCCESAMPTCCEGPSLGDYGGQMMAQPPVAPMPNLAPAPTAPRLVPQPQAQPQPYTPTMISR